MCTCKYGAYLTVVWLYQFLDIHLDFLSQQIRFLLLPLLLHTPPLIRSI